MTKLDLDKFRRKTAKTSEKMAKEILFKSNDVTFEELEERDNLLTYSTLQKRLLSTKKEETK